jgi:hypothetical protein
MQNKNPMRNKVAIRKLVSELVGFPEGGFIVEPPLGTEKRIEIRWPDSRKMTKEQKAGWQKAKRRLESDYPGWEFDYA